jgi:diacylglycerol kinase family enzyme
MSVEAHPEPCHDAAPLTMPGSGSLLVLINPSSGEGEAARKREVLQRVFTEAGRPCEMVPVASPRMLAGACEAAGRQAAASDGVLVAVGGDGTLNTAAQAAIAHGVPLGVIPQGTFNYFGRVHGISLDLESAARALVHASPTPVQVALLNGKLFLVNASLGLYPQLLQDREAFKAQFGRHRWVALLSGLVTLFKWRHQLRVEIEVDGQVRPVRTPTLVVGNNRLQLERLGLAPEVVGRVGAGELAALVVRPIGTGAMLWLMLQGAFGRLGEAQDVESFAVRSLTVSVRGMRRVKVAADGEVGAMSTPIRFEVSPRPLLLMMPQPQDRVEVA